MLRRNVTVKLKSGDCSVSEVAERFEVSRL